MSTQERSSSRCSTKAPASTSRTCLNDPTEPENLEREDGRGLFLMRKLMDRVERFSNQGNVVRMTLKRA